MTLVTQFICMNPFGTVLIRIPLDVSPFLDLAIESIVCEFVSDVIRLRVLKKFGFRISSLEATSLPQS
jgi:hypothetical protein